jgi:aryl sulfotransferase
VNDGVGYPGLLARSPDALRSGYPPVMAANPRRPERTQTYKDMLTDTDRWDAYIPRDDDVFVCTIGKNGTTWMQAICALLIFQEAELDFNPAERSPWFDVTFQPLDEVVAALEAQTERRVIKTHTPLDGIPYRDSCTYITVYRDPRDAFFSLRNHMDNMKMIAIDVPAMEPDEAFRFFVDTPYTPGGPPMGLESAVAHYDSYWNYRHLPNIHFFHYSDLKRDLRGEMKKVAAALGIEVAPEMLSELADAASFENMKSHPEKFIPGAKMDAWHDPSRFLHKGTSGQWKDILTAESVDAFETKLAQLLPPDRAEWLKQGRG